MLLAGFLIIFALLLLVAAVFFAIRHFMSKNDYTKHAAGCGILAVVFLVAGIVVAPSQNKAPQQVASQNTQGQKAQAQPQEQQKQSDYIPADINILLNDVKTNAARANKNYKGKKVKITGGVVSNIESNGYYICVDDNQPVSFVHVQCYPVNEDVKISMLDVNVKQPVTIYGQISDVGEIVGYSLKMDKIEPVK